VLDMWMCVRNIRGAKEGELFSSYGEIFRVIDKTILTRMDKKIKLSINKEEINSSFRKIENSYLVYGAWNTKGCINFLRKLLNLKVQKKIGYSRVNLDIFDNITLHRIYTELLLYIYKVRSEELLIQFSTIIKYQLESLNMIYENKDLINFDEELEQTIVQFRKIYEFCNSIESRVKSIVSDHRDEIIKQLMEKRKEINKLNILMLDEISK